MLPLHDDVPTRHTAWVTYGLIALNVAVYLYMLSLPAARQLAFVEQYGVVPSRLLHNLTLPEWSTLITSQFIHGSLLHIGGNMLVLWIFGNNVEDRLGGFRYLAFYLVCGVVAGLTQVYSAPGSDLPGIGASGAIAGVLAAYLLWYPRASVLTLIPIVIIPWLVRLPALIVIVGWFLLQLLQGIAALGQGVGASGGVAWWAHVGGFVAGLILGPLLAAGRPAPVQVRSR